MTPAFAKHVAEARAHRAAGSMLLAAEALERALVVAPQAAAAWGPRGTSTQSVSGLSADVRA